MRSSGKGSLSPRYHPHLCSAQSTFPRDGKAMYVTWGEEARGTDWEDVSSHHCLGVDRTRKGMKA